jgi:radical SAM protein with 4Fe4S-binding SPASM domain
MVSQLAEQGCYLLKLSGGEPTLRADFPAVVRRVAEAGMQYGFNTNATTLRRAHFKLLERFPPITVGVSLYGADSATHDAITRSSGSFEKTLQGITALRRASIPVTIKVIVMKANLPTLEKVATLADKLDCRTSFDPHIFPRQDGDVGPLRLALSSKALSRFLRSPFARVRDAPFSGWSNPGGFVCTAGLDRCAVDPYGDVYPCAAFPLLIGSLREGKLRSILDHWRGTAATELPVFSDYPRCLRCLHREWCRPCPGVSLLEEGNPKTVSRWICFATRSQQLLSPKPTKTPPPTPRPRVRLPQD